LAYPPITIAPGVIDPAARSCGTWLADRWEGGPRTRRRPRETEPRAKGRGTLGCHPEGECSAHNGLMVGFGILRFRLVGGRVGWQSACYGDAKKCAICRGQEARQHSISLIARRRGIGLTVSSSYWRWPCHRGTEGQDGTKQSRGLPRSVVAVELQTGKHRVMKCSPRQVAQTKLLIPRPARDLARSLP
jgi:hypothetical protein